MPNFNASYMLIVPLQLQGAGSYFDVCSPCTAEYENENIAKMDLTAEETPFDPSRDKFALREIQMVDQQGQFIIPATAAKAPVFIFAVVLYLLAFNAIDVMDDDNLNCFQRSYSDQCSIDRGSQKPLAKWWGITPDKDQKTVHASTQREIMTMLNTSLS